LRFTPAIGRNSWFDVFLGRTVFNSVINWAISKGKARTTNQSKITPKTILKFREVVGREKTKTNIKKKKTRP
jgi:hypothetical protein